MKKKIRNLVNRITFVLILLILVVLLFVVIKDNTLHETMLKYEKMDFLERKVDSIAEELEHRTNMLYEMIQRRGGMYEYYDDDIMPQYRIPNIDNMPNYEMPLEGE